MEELHDIHALVPLEEYEEFKKVSEALALGTPINHSSEKATEQSSGSQSDDDYLSRLKS